MSIDPETAACCFCRKQDTKTRSHFIDLDRNDKGYRLGACICASCREWCTEQPPERSTQLKNLLGTIVGYLGFSADMLNDDMGEVEQGEELHTIVCWNDEEKIFTLIVGTQPQEYLDA